MQFVTDSVAPNHENHGFGPNLTRLGPNLLIILTWSLKDPRQQSSKVEKSNVLGLSFPKHKTLLKNSI